MAKGNRSDDVENPPVADPEGPPLPRLSADDGQGHLAEPVDEYDHPSLHSDLAPPPDDVDGDDEVGGDEEVAEQTTETTAAEPDQTAGSQPNTSTSPRLSREEEYFIRVGQEQHRRMMEQGQPPARQPQRQTQPQNQADEDEEAVDPEVDKIASRIEKRVARTLAPHLEQTRRIVDAYNQSETRSAVTHDRQLAASTVDAFIKSNPVLRNDPEAAEYVKTEIQEQVDQHLEGYSQGAHNLRLDMNKLKSLAAAKTARIQKLVVGRSVRQTQQRTEVANRTRSTAGGTSPTAGNTRPAGPPSDRELQKRADAAAHKAGLR